MGLFNLIISNFTSYYIKTIMKKTLLFFLFSFTAYSLSAQYVFPNFSFENWTDGEPDGWYTDNAHAISVYPVTQSADAHSGLSAVKGEVLNYNTWTAPNFGSYSGTLFEINQQYATLNFYYKFNKLNNDVIVGSIAAYSASGYPLGFSEIRIKDAVSAYTPIAAPITWLFPDSVPAELAMVFGIEDTVSNTATPGSYFIFDDFSLGWFTALDVEENTAANENVVIFANPANDVIAFSVPEKNPVNTVSVFDVTGKQVVKPFTATSSRIEIPATDLADGVYFLNIQNASPAGRQGENLRVKKVAVRH